MKTLCKILTIISIAFNQNLFTQEPVIFHYNFSFEGLHAKLGRWSETDDIKNLSLKIFDSKKHMKWEREFQNSDLSLNNGDYCLMTDTLLGLKKSSEPYGLKVNYSLTSGIIDSTEFIFSFPDSVENLALELFFDQALIVKAGNYDELLFLRKSDEYKTDPKPKPVLIVKYLDPDEEIFLEPTWFDYFRITKRPKYILHNNSNYGISTPTKDMFSCFFGKLMYLDSNNHWGSYPYGGMCGTINCSDVLEVGQAFQVVEGYPIGNPRKLREGYYRYLVPFKDIAGIEKTIDTYFSVYYSR